MIGADATTIGTEIERKFLLRDRESGPAAVAGLTGIPLLQGYFRDIEGWSVRLRAAGGPNEEGRAWLTLKSRDAAVPYSSAMRREIESPVDPDLAGRLLGGLAPERCIVKTRYSLPVPGTDLHWEIDRFEGRHAGLWLAEIELPSADHPIDLPDWLGEEVTRDKRYSNANLAAVPSELPDDLPGPLPADIDRMARSLLAAAGASVAPPAPEPSAGRDRSAGRRAERALRQARLEQALRANLQRRKQQVRAREHETRELETVAAPALDRDDPAQ